LSKETEKLAVVSDKELADILIVEDSATVRKVLAAWLCDLPWVGSVSAVADGLAAIAALARSTPHVIVLDLKLPGPSGLTLIPHFKRFAPQAAILICSALVRAGAEEAIACLEQGASDVIAKPTATESAWLASGFRSEFARRVQALAGFQEAPPEPHAAARSELTGVPDLIVIGASTGGPQALQEFLGKLARLERFPPIVVAQHVPALFSSVIVDHLRLRCGLAVELAQDETVARPGRVYVAPGGSDITVRGTAGGFAISLHKSANRKRAAPSVDLLFESAAASSKVVVGVVLSGMGEDGLAGAKAIVAAGGAVLAQSRASSVVWGMPGIVATSGIASDIQAPDILGGKVTQLIAGRGRM
jgi:two-component system chemotaxis response regulator CheB